MVLIFLAVILLLFGAPRLPGMARSLGQSMRIFKAEVKDMREDTGETPEGPSVVTAGGDEEPQAPSSWK
ncbi:twin-arginine translocase TatA/TatE family subunit [Kocuria sp. SM24M-10]|uniref:twin-arginine translocase TatA/TatE family subunit n=1 Tax=Kocuria sp. SM24M-10 TaxID=1660349 RepID=UPI001EF149C0|nr:twin-arginine translocase TatA/TatE family subunit [Kocuria sp. SM24M-10]